MMSAFRTIKGWFAAQAEQLFLDFIPDDGQPLRPDAGYVRIWLAEGFLRAAKTWGNAHFPAVHGGAALTFGAGGRSEFIQFTRSPDMAQMAGRQLDFSLTPLLPYFGGVVEVQAALYQATQAGPLATAVSITGALASLAGPPLATAAAIADKVGLGLSEVLTATGNQPKLGIHCAFEAPGGNGRALRSGHLVVVRGTREQLNQPLQIIDGQLSLSGFDFVMLRVECRTEPDAWITPPIRAQIDAARTAFLKGYDEDFHDRRQEAIISAWTNPDLLLRDRRRLAVAVAEAIDEVVKQGVVPGDTQALEELLVSRLPAVDDPGPTRLKLGDLTV